MTPRAAAVLLDAGRLLLIHRVRNSEDYWVLPGGSVEPGESYEEACRRELREETGLEIEIVKMLGRLHNRGREEFYYLARRLGGTLTFGGPELLRSGKSNNYELVWVDVQEFPRLDLRPVEMRRLIAEQISGQILRSRRSIG